MRQIHLTSWEFKICILSQSFYGRLEQFYSIHPSLSQLLQAIARNSQWFLQTCEEIARSQSFVLIVFLFLLRISKSCRWRFHFQGLALAFSSLLSLNPSATHRPKHFHHRISRLLAHYACYQLPLQDILHSWNHIQYDALLVWNKKVSYRRLALWEVFLSSVWVIIPAVSFRFWWLWRDKWKKKTPPNKFEILERTFYYLFPLENLHKLFRWKLNKR